MTESSEQFACASQKSQFTSLTDKRKKKVYKMSTKESKKQPFTVIIDKYFTTNINIHYMIKKLECDYILKLGIPTL